MKRTEDVEKREEEEEDEGEGEDECVRTRDSRLSDEVGAGAS